VRRVPVDLEVALVQQLKAGELCLDLLSNLVVHVRSHRAAASHDHGPTGTGGQLQGAGAGLRFCAPSFRNSELIAALRIAINSGPRLHGGGGVDMAGRLQERISLGRCPLQKSEAFSIELKAGSNAA